ncbi:uncharacterized protein CDAR_103511 [Caerostris darwini]|uniref:Uncharacterized protein n=1 Tax=Caerostris darwini TaxID=1538125 RepID=A0AAV4PN10_9ARAC|nr:uncharacterized protein CDAR_103511 [Caerostris darwini]
MRPVKIRIFYRMFQLLIAFILFTTALGGTACPSRGKMYPCTCINIQASKTRMYTLVNCHHLHNSDSLNAILPALRSMEIDQFHLFDSFWQAHELGDAEKKGVMPMNWLTFLKIKEIEIYDTALSSSFACQEKTICKNYMTKRFSVRNSSVSDKIHTLCETGKGNSYSWISCMSELEEFHYSHGRLTSIGADMFPIEMRKLVHLNLTRNQISSVRQGAFSKLKRLTTLDLSHNQIEYLNFFTTEMELKFLDLSWNRIKEIDSTQLTFLTKLEKIAFESNALTKLDENSWKKCPASLKYVDLRENLLHCGCNMRWINNVFPAKTVIKGRCSTPKNYEKTSIRQTSQLLKKSCDENGNIITKKRTSYTSPISLI